MRMLRVDVCSDAGCTQFITMLHSGFSLLLTLLETHPCIHSYQVHDLTTMKQIFPESAGYKHCVKWEPLGYKRKSIEVMPWESGNPDA